MQQLIKNGRVIDPANHFDQITDVLLDGGTIAQIGANISADDAEVFDATNLVVAPGFIDIHVHGAHAGPGI